MGFLGSFFSGELLGLIQACLQDTGVMEVVFEGNGDGLGNVVDDIRVEESPDVTDDFGNGGAIAAWQRKYDRPKPS